MDLDTVTEIVPASSRADLGRLGPTTVPLAGGSWLYSEPNRDLTGLLDLTAFGWPSLTVTGQGLEIAATCTLAELADFPPQPGWTAHPLLRQCCTALYGSFKIWSVATVGGNIATALPAGPMTSLAAALDADALLWSAAGERRLPVAELVTGDRQTALAEGEVLRSVTISDRVLRSRTAFRKRALSPLGRSGSVVIGRLDEDGAFVLTVTAATLRPVQRRFAGLPDSAALTEAVATVDAWFTDPHGAADWRRAVSLIMAQEIVDELAGS